MTLRDRFDAKWTPEPTTGCWLWTAAVSRCGYGAIGTGRASPRQESAHRVAYELFVAPIPQGMLVRHSCDNKLCVNPGHLLVGTTQDNIADKVSRHRQPAGVSHGRAKLSPSDVQAIRQMVQCGERKSVLSKRFGVSRSHILRIARCESWANPREAA